MTDVLTPAQIDANNRFGAAAPNAWPTLPPVSPPSSGEQAGRRRWFWPTMVVVVLAVGTGSYLGGRLTATGPGPTVVTVSQGLVAGAPVSASDLALTHITNPPAGAVRTIAAATGKTALRGVPAGGVLVGSDIGPATAFPTPGMALVGISVKPGQAPADPLQPGDTVVAVEPPPNANGATGKTPRRPVTLTGAVQVISVQQISGAESVTVEVRSVVSTALAAQAAAGNVALLQVAKPVQ